MTTIIIVLLAIVLLAIFIRLGHLLREVEYVGSLLALAEYRTIIDQRRAPTRPLAGGAGASAVGDPAHQSGRETTMDALRLGPVELILAACCLAPLLVGIAAWIAVRFAGRARG
jgi:hypothetical protein